MTAADKYYLKAKDNYPYDMDEALEALEYGLSCDDTHPGLLTLQGNIYYRNLCNFDLAIEYYELALFYDNRFTDTYYPYIQLCIDICNYTKAKQLIKRAATVPGIDKAQIAYRTAKMFEKQEMYKDAVAHINIAITICTEKECNTFLNDELERVQLKIKNKHISGKKINIILT